MCFCALRPRKFRQREVKHSHATPVRASRGRRPTHTRTRTRATHNPSVTRLFYAACCEDWRRCAETEAARRRGFEGAAKEARVARKGARTYHLGPRWPVRLECTHRCSSLQLACPFSLSTTRSPSPPLQTWVRTQRFARASSLVLGQVFQRENVTGLALAGLVVCGIGCAEGALMLHFPLHHPGLVLRCAVLKLLCVCCARAVCCVCCVCALCALCVLCRRNTQAILTLPDTV